MDLFSTRSPTHQRRPTVDVLPITRIRVQLLYVSPRRWQTLLSLQVLLYCVNYEKPFAFTQPVALHNDGWSTANTERWASLTSVR